MNTPPMLGRSLRLAARIAGVILLLIALTVLIVIVVFNPNDYKDDIAAFVKERTGRELIIDGDLNLSLFPWFGLETGRVQLNNTAEFNSTPFAIIDRAELRVRLWPLLFSRVEVDTIKLDGTSVTLEQQANGKTNWQDLLGNTGPGGPDVPLEPKIITINLPTFTLEDVQIKPGNLFTDPANRLGSAHIENAQITLNDLTQNTTETFSGIDVTIGEVRLAALEEPIAVTLAFDLTSQAPPASAQVTFTTQVSADMAAKFYRLDATKVTVDFNITQPGAQGTLLLTTDASFDDSTRKLDLPSIRIVSDVRYAGDQRRTHAELQSSASYTLTTQVLQVSPFKLTANTQGAGLPEAGTPLTVNTSIAGDFKKQTLSVQDLAVQAANVIASGNLQIEQLKTAPSFRGTLTTEPFDVRALLTQTGLPVPVTQDKQVLKKAAVAIEFQGTKTQGRVDKFTAHLDDTTLNASASIENFSKPRTQFELALDSLNIDRYLPPPVKGEPTATPSTPGSAAAAGASELPLETLRSLDLNGSIKAGRITASKLTVTDLNATLTAKAGMIQLHPLRAKLYDGTYDGKITLDARGKALKITADENLSEVQMGPITTVFLGKPSIEGRGSLKLKVNTEGTDSSSWLRALSGTTNFSLRDGKVVGVDITQVLADGVKLYKKDDPAKPKEGKNELTRFATLAASATIKDGMLTSHDLNLAAKELAFSGAGNVNLVDQSIDYTVTAIATEYAAEKLGKYLKDVKNIPIDGIISGPLREPKFDLDVGSSLERRAKQEVKQKVDEKKQEAVQKIEKKVEDKLKKFFGQ